MSTVKSDSPVRWMTANDAGDIEHRGDDPAVQD
jgi:hypothetical protein